jgi:mannose-6-phosphate isomerase-like protein (cupin superfamily)
MPSVRREGPTVPSTDDWLYEPPEPGFTEINSWDEVPEFADEDEEARWWDTHCLGPELLKRFRRMRDWLADGELNFWANSSFSLAPQALRVEKPWGHEVVWAQTDAYAGKLIHIKAGRRLSLQYHKEKTETQCLLSGRATLVIDGPDGMMHEVEMEPGKGYTIHPDQRHRLIALEDCVVVEVSTPEKGKTVRLQDDYARPDETDELRGQPGRGWQEPGDDT